MSFKVNEVSLSEIVKLLRNLAVVCLSFLKLEGDIRAAINALQFMYNDKSMKRIEGGKKVKKKAVKRNEQKKVGKSEVGVRETSLVLFHALGKVLSGKRTNTAESGKMKELTCE
jgi:hypothetical protein